MRIDDAAFTRLKQLVIDRTLHHYYENKDDQLRDRLHRRLSATGLDPAAYLALLQNGEASEWSSLESEVTINETFFFRFAEQFGCLQNTILPSLIAARAATRRLRIWSAGCSTGAEPYSVAILLHRLLGSALRDWSISILGTDIDEAALATARAGDFTDWALRSLSPEERRRDFIPLDGDRGRHWSLRPAFRTMVRFEKHNLLDSLRSPPGAGVEYDLVLCRNVLIYFHQDTVRALVRRFGAVLAADGWLLLGHAEAVGHTLDELRPVSLDGTVVWQRLIPAEPPEPAPALRGQVPIATVRTAKPPRPVGTTRVRACASAADAQVRLPTPRTQAPTAAAVPAPGLAAAIESVRALADRGLPEAALAACRAALEQHPLGAELFFYAALLNRALDRDGDAEADFRRALYLCKSFAMAHYHLGLLLTDTGRPGPARRFIAEARSIVGDMDDDAPLPCGDGMTAGRLAALSRQDWFTQKEPG